MNARDERRARAKGAFIRLMVLVVIAGVVMVGAVLAYLSRFTDMPLAMIVAVVGGVFVSVVLGAGLMATVFYSARSGHDEEAGEQPDHETFR